MPGAHPPAAGVDLVGEAGDGGLPELEHGGVLGEGECRDGAILADVLGVVPRAPGHTASARHLCGSAPSVSVHAQKACSRHGPQHTAPLMVPLLTMGWWGLCVRMCGMCGADCCLQLRGNPNSGGSRFEGGARIRRCATRVIWSPQRARTSLLTARVVPSLGDTVTPWEPGEERSDA